ncbi:glycosyltransferase family 9 protein [Marinomonas sp. 2405UD68-3]|uniref:glycosyltransferase family 9 protein n=1 Tax=Marinomonas sp. 2405UD68-3 TaxID=3391835 RepID=UPI0039C96238
MGLDEEEIQYIQNLGAINNLSLHINMTLHDISKLVNYCDLTIANDCGPSYITQCMQKPYTGFFREPNVEWFPKHSKSVKVLPFKGHSIKTITTDNVTEFAVNLSKGQK